MSRRRRLLIALAWLACLACAAIIVARARYITDLSAFLPAHPTKDQQILVDQLRDGAASRLILIAIEGADASLRARVSKKMVEALRRDAQFVSVDNGSAGGAQGSREFLFQHRYLLSDAVNPARFAAPGLRAAIQETIDNLASPAGLMVKSLLPRDPTGELLNIIDRLGRAPSPSTRDGVWVSRDGTRALAVAATLADGTDSDAQARAIDAIRAAFSAAARKPPEGAPNALELKLSGPGVFAVGARAKIEGAAVRLSLAGAILVSALLLLVYRSAAALALGLLPVISGALIGIAAVAAGFGAVHGVTLGFGATLIGESVDYSIYFLVQSQPPASGFATDWQQRWWPTIRLGMLTSVCGFASLLPSGFPGLRQLGLYSIGGLIAAALVTRFVLPALRPAGLKIRDMTPFGVGVARLVARLHRIGGRAVAALGLLLMLAALALLYQHRNTLWNRELSALSPISMEQQRYDEELRADLGAADLGDLVIVSGADLEAVLRGAEKAAVALEPLVSAAVIGDFDSPANYLPSMATQEARRDSLPDAAQLQSNLREAIDGLPVNADTLRPFLDDVEVTRHAALVTARDLGGTSMATGFAALIMHRDDRWNALLPLHAAARGQGIDAARVAAALAAAHVEDARVLDIKQESDALYAGYLGEAIQTSLAGLLAIGILLLIALRSIERTLRVLAPLLLAVLTVAAALAVCGVQLTLLHLVGMLLIVAVGSNYALFFDRVTVLGAGEALTLASLLIANTATVVGFGLLCFSQVPVLVDLGATVAPGAFLALLFAAAGSRA